jgi:hypothetical protein
VKIGAIYVFGIYIYSRVAIRYTNIDTKVPNLNIFWRYLEWKILNYFISLWNILRPFCISYAFGIHILPHFGILNQEKSGNPELCNIEANFLVRDASKENLKAYRASSFFTGY